MNLKPLLYDWAGANEVLFLAINSIRGPQYDRFMQAISWIGEHEHFPYYFAAVFAFAALSLLLKTMRGQRGKWFYMTSWLGVLLVLGVGYAATGAVTNTLKDYFAYPRPYVALVNTHQVHKLEATEPRDDFRSFPSGHVVFTTLMVMALTPMLSGLLAWGGVALIALMAWSRLSLGMHFPADVIASILIAAPLISGLRWAIYTLLRKFFNIKC
ncbi:MAG: phosphatase PAP2 family protein [Alphaproteobacteria bacterium]|nr:phosphatase PAP2 family protein [Alphaproteobacteria bacterium]